jgi:hypothetical protein
MRPLQSSTSFRKPATVSKKSNAGILRLTAFAAKSTREPPYTPTPLESSLVGFDGLDDNPIKGLTSVLSVEQVLNTKLTGFNTSEQV